MKPGTLLRWSVVLNVLLILCAFGLVWSMTVPIEKETGITYSEIPGTYPESMTVREYRDAADHGLTLTYTEYLERKSPDRNSDLFGGPYYYLSLHELPIDPDFPAGSLRIVEITDTKLLEHPPLADLFSAHIPFSFVRVNVSEMQELEQFVTDEVILYRDGIFYGHLAVAELVLGSLTILTTGFCIFAYTRKKLSEDPNSREMILCRFVLEHPGCMMRDLTINTGYSRGSVSYQLLRLEREKKIRKDKHHGCVRYFPRKGQTDPEEQILRDVLEKDRPCRIFSTVLDEEGMSRQKISEKTNIPVSTVRWHLGRMMLDGILLMEKSGGKTQYRVCEVFADVYTRLRDEKSDD